MAEEPEQRMLFDLRGRRKRVIQVIYVLLALIMVASLVVIGLPGNISPFSSGAGGVDTNAAEVSINRSENLEARIAAEPNNLAAKEELIRARTSAGKALSEIDPATGQVIVTSAAGVQYDLAADAWDDYLKAAKGNPDPSVALLMAQTFNGLSIGGTVARFESNSKEAVKAQEIVVENAKQEFKKGEGQSPATQMLQLAYFQYLAQDPKAAAATGKEALTFITDETEIKQFKAQLKTSAQQGASIARQLKAARQQAKQDGGQSLQEPAGSLGTQDSAGAAATAP
ncbi:MAG: hypothetical protein WBP55_09120 [Solirubrobacterales bacterium]